MQPCSRARHRTAPSLRLAARFAVVALAALAALSIGAAGRAVAEEAPPGALRLPRNLALSPDGEQVIVSYAGDLWLADTAAALAGPAPLARLSAHPAHDDLPLVSPRSAPGRPLVAFASARDGASQPDVYLMAPGEAPRRLTFDSARDEPIAFSADGRVLYVRSWREAGYPDGHRIYAIDLDDPREPALVIDEGVQDLVEIPATWGALADATRFVVGRNGAAWWLEDHRSASASDLWRVPAAAADPLASATTTEPWQRLTDSRVRERWPLLGPERNRVYWVSARDGTPNLWSMPLDGGAAPTLQHTRFEGDGVRAPALAARRGTIAFEAGERAWLYDPAAGGAPRPLWFAEPGEVTEDHSARRRVQQASELAASPKGDAIAFVAHGEVFVRRAEDGWPVRLTDAPSREHDIAWAPDGESLYVVSDRAGARAIYRLRSADPQEKRLHRALRHELELVVGGVEDHSAPLPTPDGKGLLFIRGVGALCWLDLEQPASPARVLNDGFSEPEVELSPCGRWVALSREDDEFNRDVWLLELETGRLENVSAHPGDDHGPAWSPDGRKLAFISTRVGREPDVHFVYLRREDDERARQDELDQKEDERAQKAKKPPAKPAEKPAEKAADNGEPSDKAEDAKASVRVEVSPEPWRRVRMVQPLLGAQDWVAFTHDSERLILRSEHEGKRDLWTIKLDGSDLKRVTTGATPSALSTHHMSKSIYFLRGGQVPAKVGDGGGSVTTWGFDVVVQHPLAAERAQVFDEAWRTMRDRWYDGTFKGHDWEAVRVRYRDLAVSRRSHEEFQDVLRMMLGELRGSHLGVGGGGPPRGTDAAAAPSTGRLGLRLAPGLADGDGWTVLEVLPEGPCDRAGVRLEPGDVVVSIHGEPLGSRTRLAPLLAGKVGEQVELEVRRRSRPSEDAPPAPPAPPETERLLVRPMGDGQVRQLAYEAAAARARAVVEERSQGRLGYLHIARMDQQSLDRFEAELYARGAGREGLVIDVRNNGGGWIADHLLAILAGPAHAYTVPRGGGVGYPQSRRPIPAWTRPIIVLANERSFSNAEIFAHAVKTTGRGKVVGRETAGGVISTGATTLLDGSRLRVPFRGWFVLTTGVDMEAEGCVPDLAVENVPGAPGDAQLEAAIEALLGELAD